jgi:hypothetical protein
MGEATYRIVRKGMSWAIDHDGAMEGDYATKEAAFEAAAAAASTSIHDGFGVMITVPARAIGESNLGTPPA